MESFEESNCHSMSDSFSLYERYLRSFSVVDNLIEDNGRKECEQEEAVSSSSSNCDISNNRGNIDLSAAIHSSIVNKHYVSAAQDIESELYKNQSDVHLDKGSCDTDGSIKQESSCTSIVASLLENSTGTASRSLLYDKSNQTDVPVSDDSKSNHFKHPVFITSTMENSNNAVDSVPMFRDVRPSESVFKLPIRELTFNGTIKHVQKLKPIVDPITAFSAVDTIRQDLVDEHLDSCKDVYLRMSENISSSEQRNSSCAKMYDLSNDISTESSTRATESTGDSQYEELPKKELKADVNEEVSGTLEQSYSSFEASFDSGVRSPDMFSDEDGPALATEAIWSFLKQFEVYEKRKLRKMEETLSGIPPPPSVTTIRIDATEMLRKYYSHLPAFIDESVVRDQNIVQEAVTPTKRVSFVEIPQVELPIQETTSSSSSSLINKEKTRSSIISKDIPDLDLSTSTHDKSVDIQICTESEAKETAWPDLLKCKYYDVYYNLTSHSEKLESLALKYGERFVGAETSSSVNIYSGGLQSPSSASKRKAMRLKMAQAKSPGRRLSHLALRRQAFCSAATIKEKAQASTAKMVLIDKNYFPHRKLINSLDRKSPRMRRTPGKKTPGRKTPGKKTPGKKTPAKTPKTKSGGSSRKKAMRRLLMDTDSLSRSQPTRETLKRALFVSPENRKQLPVPSCSSVPLQAMKSKRALFGSPNKPAVTKSLDGSQSDQFMKRKLDSLDGEPETSRSKIAKSLSFGGDIIGSSLNSSLQLQSFGRRASEVFTARQTTELNETHKKKLLWAVSEALRAQGWRMSSPGFREKASALARLTRKMLSLPKHAAKLAAPKLSTSEMMFKLARQYTFAIIQGRTVEDCFEEEKCKLANEASSSRVTGYISASAYQQLKARPAATITTFTSQIKENTCNTGSLKQEPRSSSKNILQDKMLNIDSNSSSSSGFSMFDKAGLYKSNSMPSFEEAAKMRARRQISFDNVDFPKR